ncbi:hypothetical protein TNCV_4688961 [Trichonephila clavipes]|nr:hypothetical protein TNCV_4688961 [Trichonephila clavipes]
MFKLYPLIGRNSELSRDNKVLLFTAVMRPILAYGCPVWGYAAKTNIYILDTLQNSTIRMIVKVEGSSTAIFYHTAANCFMKPRCLKCGKDHARETVTSKNDKKTHFVSTARTSHSACYTKCPKFPNPKKALPFPTRLKENFSSKWTKEEFPSLTLLGNPHRIPPKPKT